MKRIVLLRLVLAAVFVVSAVWAVDTVSAPAPPPFDNAAIAAAHPCVSDSDCPGNQICCPINSICTQPRGCRKDPL